MCAIIGFEDKTAIELDKAKECLARLTSRGPDMTRMEEAGNTLLGFNRLAIMGLTAFGMQPFSYKENKVVCNGEIYCWREQRKDLIGKGHKFVSNSDCEIILPLFEEYGVSLFGRLDAEFALVIYDHVTGGLVAARDPIGIRPLFYGYLENGSIVFCSEPKGIVDIVKEVFPFPPGHYYKNGEFIRYRDPAGVTLVSADDADQAADNIRELLVDGVSKRLDADAPLGFLLSGGLDSSLVCAIAARLMPRTKIRTFSIGMDADSIDSKYAQEVADYIGAEHTNVIMTKDEVIKALPEVIGILGTYDITTIRASMGMYLVCKYIHEKTDIRVLLTGEISDEMFGYKYTDFAPNAEAFQEESEKRIRELHYYDVLRADRCISANSLEARVPFGDLKLVQYVMGLNPAIKMNIYNKGKYLLRHAFDRDGWLPEDILQREKAAFSDAVGHSMVDDLKEFAEEKYSDSEFEKLCEKYEHSKPFTKESLLYREIFEKYYPGQSDMIPAFWMPNKDWEGCNVNDPSARVLSNYGASGM